MFLVWHVGLAFLAACAPSGAQTPEPLVKETLLSDVGDRSDIETVKLYRAALNDHDIETALSLLAKDYQLRFAGTEVLLSKADLPRILGWDRGVNGHIEWDIKGDAEALTFEGRETNDFFELLGIAHLRFRTTFRLDVKGRIIEQSYETLPAQVSTEEAMKPAVQWAQRNRPAELREIYPDGRMIYTEDMGRRWVALLREWASETGQ